MRILFNSYYYNPDWGISNTSPRPLRGYPQMLAIPFPKGNKFPGKGHSHLLRRCGDHLHNLTFALKLGFNDWSHWWRVSSWYSQYSKSGGHSLGGHRCFHDGRDNSLDFFPLINPWQDSLRRACASQPCPRFQQVSLWATLWEIQQGKCWHQRENTNRGN